MPRKRKRSHYGDYCEERADGLYAVVQIPIGGGKHRKRRKRVGTRYEARQWALEQLRHAHHGPAGDLETFIDLAEWYAEYFLQPPVYERGLKVQGVKDWRKSRAKLDRMAAHFGPKRLAAFAERDLLAYARHRREKDGVSTATINRDFALMRAMFRKGHEHDPNIKLPRFPINTAAEHERDRVMSFDEERALLAVCDDTEALEYVRPSGTVSRTTKHRTNRGHLRAIIILAVDTAMRANEIYSLTWDDIDLENGVITVQSRNTKTQRMRKIGMTPRVRAEIERLRSAGSVFGIKSARKAFATACRKAGIKDLHFHDLRHTGTTRMVRAGIPHTEVMKITGHSQIRTFLRYLNLGDTTVQSVAERLGRYLDDSTPEISTALN